MAELVKIPNAPPALPIHVAVIMDGNGRWAEQRGLPKFMGHEAGMETMIKIVRRASDMGIGHLTVYAFSTENWKRSTEEVSGIFKLLRVYVDRELAELHKNNVKVDVLGNWDPFSKPVTASLNKTIQQTANNTGLRFHIALNYGSRIEILGAVNRIVANVQDDGCQRTENSQITEEEFTRHLYTEGIPDPDLVIRPGGERRLSNFLLWQTAYSELVFSDVLWPDFSPEEFDKAIAEYGARKRRFGGRA
jgi:undecaprenyl diphosphate synthase